MKKIVLALFFVVCCSVFVSATSEAAQFKDVKKNSSYYEAVNALSNEGIINGKKPNVFAPNDTLTRAQASKMIVLSLDMKQASKRSSFKDIKSTSSYAPFIETLAAENIINGYNDGRFKPNATLNKRQLAKIIANAYHLDRDVAKVKLPFKDIKKGSDEEQYVKMLYKAGIIKKSSKFQGNKKVTRGQFAQMVYLAQQAAVTLENLTITHSDEKYVYTSMGALKYANHIEVERLDGEFTANVRRGEIIAVTEGYAKKVLLRDNQITVSGKQGVAKNQMAVYYADLGVGGIISMEVHPSDTKKVAVEHALQREYNYCDFQAPIDDTQLSTGDYTTSPQLSTADYYTNQQLSTGDYNLNSKLSTADYYMVQPMSNTSKLSKMDYYKGTNNSSLVHFKTSMTTHDVWKLKQDSMGLSTHDYMSGTGSIPMGVATQDYMDQVILGNSTLSTADYNYGPTPCSDVTISQYDHFYVIGLQANSIARVLVTVNTSMLAHTPHYEQLELYVKVDRFKRTSLYFK